MGEDDGYRSPREILPELLRELELLKDALEAGGRRVDREAWAAVLLHTDPDFLRRLAQFREGVAEAMSVYPAEWFGGQSSPDRGDPEGLAWHEFVRWFSDGSAGGPGRKGRG